MGLRFYSVWVGIAAMLPGCGSKPLSADAPQPPTLAPPVSVATSIEQACADLQAAACAAFQRCAPQVFGSTYPDEASCVERRSADCIERRLARGNTVTPEQVEACAAVSRTSTCSAVIATEYGINPVRDPACVWQGTLAEGEACITSSQCASGSCSFYGRDKCGTCVTRSDTSCAANGECLVGSLCISGQCLVASKEGEPCGSLQPCSAELDCAAGACVPLGQAGDRCGAADTGGCARDLWCNRQTDTCERSILLPGPGACGPTPSGGNALCPAGSSCRPDASGGNHCTPVGGEGATCSYQLECAAGLDCRESVCSKLQAEQCLPAQTTPNPTYPAFLPSVPQGVAPSNATLLTTPKAVLVTFEGDERASTLEAFVNALGPSKYWHSVTSEYGVGRLEALTPIRVAETPPARLSDDDVQAWLVDKLSTDARFPANDGLTLYIVAYPRGVSIAIPGASADMGESSCRDFGGYHQGFIDENGVASPYAVIPDCFYIDPEGAISHEAVEAVTDPFPNLRVANLPAVRGYLSVDVPHTAWSLPAGGGAELADLCEWQPLAGYRDPEIGGLVQRSWSNAAMAGFHQPCVPARRGSAYFNSVPHFDDTITIQLLGGPVRTHGISIPIGQSKTVPVDLLSDGPMDGPWRVSAYDLKEWNNEFDYTAGTEPTLGFSFDQQSGVNGDTLHMTITVLQQDQDFQAEPFVLVSRRGRETNLWLGVVGQP